MPTINYLTKVIYVPQSELANLGGGIYELDVEDFRIALKDSEDSEAGIAQPVTHSRNAPVTLAGVTFAQTFEIINGYTVEFESGSYTVKCVGANHNIGDVKVVNPVSLIVGNSAGLIATGGASPWTEVITSSYTAAQILRILAAVAAGKTNIVDLGGGAATVEIRDLGDTKNVVVAGMTGSERSTVTLDGT